MQPGSPAPTSAQAEDQAQARRHRFGIQNRLIYWGIVVLMATLLLWLGVELAKRIEWFLPYSGGLALSLIALGYFLEIRKARKARQDICSRQEQDGTDGSQDSTGHPQASPMETPRSKIRRL